MALDRRAFLRTGAAAGAALVAGAAPLGGAPARPNVLLILSDDMGFSDLGCYGGEIRTPNLDRLAAGGLRFTQFYNTARCCPTRASLLTGLYPHQAGMGHMTGKRELEGYQGELRANTNTIAEALRSAGYGTYMVGKWHVSRNERQGGDGSSWPIQRGFDHYYGTLAGAGNYFDPGALCRDNTHISAAADPLYKPAEPFYYTTALGDNGARFIEDHHRGQPDQPFFLYAAFTAAHWPLHAPESAIERVKGRYDQGYTPIRAERLRRVREMGLVKAAWDPAPQVGNWEEVPNKAWEARCMEVYAAQIELLDSAVGRLVQALEATGQLDNTLILFLQDNGACAESIGRDGQMARSARPTLPPIDPAQPVFDVRPSQTRDGWPMLSGPDIMPGPRDTFESYGRNWANVSNTPFREYKHWVHEGGISTPLIAHWPAGITRRGELEHQPGHLIDLWATCVDLANAEPPAQRAGLPVPPPEGRSLKPAFYGQRIQREALFWEHEGNRALRVGNYKLVARGPAGRWELYDISRDRGEQHDLASDQPARVQELAKTWTIWAERTKAVPWPWRPPWGEAAASSATVFNLRAGDSLDGPSAPAVAQRDITAEVDFVHHGDNGVLVAQGGDQHGFSLYIRGGALEAAIRRTGDQFWVAAPEKLTEGPHRATFDLRRSGLLTIGLDGAEVARLQLSGAIDEQPVDGLDVGRDQAGAIGRYKGPARYSGEIRSVRLELDPAR